MKVKPKISLHVTEDDCPIRGNAQASGDDENDRKCEDAILERLGTGDIWAWACVEVRAEFRGLKASEYLGGCSYTDEAAFKAGGYYTGMVAEVTNRLADMVADLQGIEIERI